MIESYRDFRSPENVAMDFFGNPDKNFEVPSLQLGYEVKFDDSDTKVVFVRALKTNGFSPFLTFRNTHAASHMCFNEFSPIFTVSNGTTYTVPDRQILAMPLLMVWVYPIRRRVIMIETISIPKWMCFLILARQDFCRY